MQRIFHRRFSLAAKCCMTIMMLIAFYLFWFKSAIHAMMGTVVVVLLVYLIERVINTKYILNDTELIIDGGRISHKQSLKLNEIITCTKSKTLFGLSHFIVISYGANRQITVQPEDDDAFINEIKKRQTLLDKEL